MIKTARGADFSNGVLGSETARHQCLPLLYAPNRASNGVAKDHLMAGGM